MTFCEPECADNIEKILNKIGLEASEIVVFEEKEKYTSFNEYLKPTGEENEFMPKKIHKDECFLVALSSGTTSQSKGMMLTHNGMLSKWKNPEKSKEQDFVMLYITSFAWMSAINMFMHSIFYGNVQVLARQLKGDTLLQIIEKYKVKFIFINLFHVYNLINNPNFEKYDLSSLAVMIVGGTVLSEEVYTKLRNKMPKSCIVANGYVLTEVCGAATTSRFPEEIKFLYTKPCSVGRGCSGTTFKVVDIETRKPVGPNIKGEICIKTNGCFKGYYNDPESTAAAHDSDGFFMTGDIGYYDEDQFFYVIDRIKDCFKCQSWPIYPVELESMLLTHPDVNEAAVIGILHEQDSERPMGIVVLKEGATATAEDILCFYNDKVSKYKKLTGGLKIVDSLPFNINGKLARKYLREQILQENSKTHNNY